MNNRFHQSRLLFLATVVLGLIGPACGPKPAENKRIFQAKGLVVNVAEDKKSVLIKHETIENFMDAMTMSFQVKDPALLQNIGRNDLINFELTVTNTEEWISKLEKTGHDATADKQSSATPGLPLLPGQTVPDFTLTNQENRPVKLSELQGKPVALTFIYTRCPIPDMCPRLNRHFSAVQKELEPKFGDKFQLLSISVDPAFDTPKVLKEFAQREGIGTKQWSFLTGPEEQIREFATNFGVGWDKDGALVTHNMASAVIKPDGTLLKVYRRADWEPQEMITDLTGLLNNQQ